MEHSFAFSAKKSEAGADRTIGEAVVTWDSVTLSINGRDVSPAGVEYLLNYGVKQALSDAFASAADLGEAKGSFAKRLDRIIAGTVSVREAGGGKDEIEAKAVSMFRAQVRAKIGADAYKAMTPAQRDAECLRRLKALDTWAQIREHAEKEVAREAREAAKLANLVGDLGL